MSWTPPKNYQPDPKVPGIFLHESPPVGSAQFDLTVYWQWTRYWWQNKTIDEAWHDLRMSPVNARKGIDDRIVPLEIYDRALERARDELMLVSTTPDKINMVARERRRSARV